MKFALLLSAVVFGHAVSYAQNSNSVSGQNKLTVTLSKDSMFVVYNNQTVPVRTIEALDSLMKKIPDPAHLSVDFLSGTTDHEKSRAISRVLGQCHCPTVSKSFNINN